MIQVSGPQALSILDRLFESPRGTRLRDTSSGRLTYGRLRRAGEFLDEVVVDCVESGPCQVLNINCHGGTMAARRVMDALEAEGARPAAWRDMLARRPGLDRIMAEAAEAIPGAFTLLAVRVLLDQHHGALSDVVRDIARRLPSENESGAAQDRLAELLATAPFGRGLIEPARVVLAGRPNVGKSTLANALLRFERMIVHTTPGTTRDAIEEIVSIRSVPFRLVDTAGLREATGEIEREGVDRARKHLREAAVRVVVLDGSMPLQPEDMDLLREGAAQPLVPVLNKCDLPRKASAEAVAETTGQDPVVVSAERGDGLAELERRIVEARYPERPAQGAAVVFTERQERHLRTAQEAAGTGDTDGAVRCLDLALGTATA